jgi:hypothetical protein
MTKAEATAQIRATFGKRAYGRITATGKEVVRWSMSLHGQRVDDVLGSGATWPDALRDAAERHPTLLRHS